MTDKALPYAGTRAARLLSEGLQKHTSQHKGGLRALATDLAIKQATVLSHMGNGRIGIPLDRAAELAEKLNMDVADFCLAVLQQRAPEVYEALEANLKMGMLASRSPEVWRACNIVANATRLSDQHVDTIAAVVSDPAPAERWLRPSEVPLVAMIRECFPDAVGASELGTVRAAIDAVRALDL